MKKLLLASTALLFALSSFAQCSDLFISEYVEGTYNNKALEIYNPTNTDIDLTNYRLVRWRDGGNASDADISLIQTISGTIQAHGTFTCFLDRRNASATGADTILFSELLTIANNLVSQNKAGFYQPVYDAAVAGGRMISFNGDDALSIQKNVGGNWLNIDIFGEIGVQPTNGSGNFSPNGAWTDTAPYDNGIGAYLTKDKTLIRKHGVTSGLPNNPTEFNALQQYDSLPENTFSNLGMHTCDCATSGIVNASDSKEVRLFPNPTSGAKDVVVYTTGQATEVTVYNMLGQFSYQAKVASNNNVRIPVSGLSKGMYILHLQYSDGSTSLKKFSVN